MAGLRLKTWWGKGALFMVGQSFRWRRAKREGLGQKREDQGRGLTEGLPDTGREPGKPRVCSHLGGGLMPLVTGAP